MQSDDGSSLVLLANKIKILKDKLMTYGWSLRQIYDFILYDFMKLPKADWDSLETTVSFYQIKEKYKVQPDAAQLILCIRQIVPNLQSREVLQYLNTVFDYSAIEYGIDVFDSSSDSSQNPRIMRKKGKTERMRIKRGKSIYTHSKTTKKVHLQSEISEKRQQEDDFQKQLERSREEPPRELRLVRKRKRDKAADFDEFDKAIKKDDL